MQIQSIGWEFDVLQANAFDDNYPRLEAVFVGVAPAVAFDAQNQPKFNRTTERHLKDLEKAVRADHQAALSTLGSADLAQNQTVIQDFIADYHQRIVDQILVDQQLELESLTLAGEWPLFWNQQTPLVQQKDREREPMPFSEPETAPNASTTTHQPTDDHPETPGNSYYPV